MVGCALALVAAAGCGPANSSGGGEAASDSGSDGRVADPDAALDVGTPARDVGVDASEEHAGADAEAGVDAGAEAAVETAADAGAEAGRDAGSPVVCSAQQQLCGASCIDVGVDTENCGACGNACPQGQVCSAGQCATTCGAPTTLCEPSGQARYCADLATDQRNCGACGTVCAAGMACDDGACSVSCPGSQINCGGTCIDPSSDRAHCGATPGCGDADAGSPGTACAAGTVCAAGACSVSCPGSQIDCGGKCIDPSSDRAHCGATPGCGDADAGSPGTACAAGMECAAGACSVSCPGSQVNCGGECIDPLTDLAHCGATAGCGASGAGSPGTPCAAGMLCAGGACSANCGGNLLKCADRCVDPANDPANCGGCGIPCNIAHGTNVCVAGECALFACDANYNQCPPAWTGQPPTACTLLSSDPANCGSCGHVCSLAHASSTCSSSACAITRCDDGYLDCDDDPADGCETGGTTCPPAKIVFVTSTTYAADMGGYMAADANCAAAATNASLSGTFLAWISDGSTTPASRLAQSTVRYALVDGTIVADNWAGLTSGHLRHAIDLTESGGTPPAPGISVCNVWTGTTASGGTTGEDCSGWSDTGSLGYAGNSSMTNGAWTTQCSGGICGAQLALYCIEQ